LKSNSAEAGRAVAGLIRHRLNADTAGVFLFADALTINFERFNTAIETELNLDHLLPLVGGLASDNWQWKHTSIAMIMSPPTARPGHCYPATSKSPVPSTTVVSR
jgi:hypothetical protein